MNTMNTMNTMDAKAKQALLALLRQLTRQIQSLDEAELAEIIEGTARVEVRLAGTKKKPNARKHDQLTDEELNQLAESLRITRTRDEGHHLLSQTISSKREMARLAKQLDIRIQKSDSADQIRARVIESTIGFRIRSAAIQGSTEATSNRPSE